MKEFRVIFAAGPKDFKAVEDLLNTDYVLLQAIPAENGIAYHLRTKESARAFAMKQQFTGGK